MLSVLLLFSACGLTKEYKHTANYAERMNSVAKQYDYKIQNISKSTDTYSFEMKNDKQLVELSFELRNEDQYNSFEFICINPKDYSFILKIVNEVSRKKFSEDKFYNVIQDKEDIEHYEGREPEVVEFQLNYNDEIRTYYLLFIAADKQP